MSEPSPDLAPQSPTQKRKRTTESASPDVRRSKRGTSESLSGLPAAATPTIDSGATAPAPAATAFMESSGQPEQSLTSAAFQVGNVGIPTANTETSDADANAARAASAAANAALAASSTAATAAAALGTMYPQLTVPTSTEESFANQHHQHTEGGEPQPQHPHAHQHQHQHQHQPQQHHDEQTAYSTVGDLPQAADGLPIVGDASMNGQRRSSGGGGMQVKPAVGTDEWHKMRKDNHKEVERRRRETINEGINELAKIVPGCEKNKGSILQRAVIFITQLKENETQNIEKWTLEKLLTEQAIGELSASNDKLKEEVERLYRELEMWKRLAQNAGLQPPAEGEKTEAPAS